MRLKSVLLKSSLFLIGCMMLNGCIKKKDTLYERQFLYFDTVITLQFYAAEDGESLMDHCVSMCGELEDTFSRTKADSELYAVNHRTSGEVEVSPEIAYLVKTGLEYYQISDGKFDITVAPLSDLWDFKSEDATVPDDKDIQDCLQYVDASSVSVEDNRLIFSSDDVQIDLGALVKGYAADLMKSYLTENGVKHGILNLGGNVLTIGSKPDKSNWRIGIQKPFSTQGEIADVAEVSDQTVVTSGIYERYFEQDGVIYHHILDPDTGYPVQGDIQSVSIITDSSLTGDALSTTCLVMSYEKARALIDSLDGVEAIFILDSGDIIKTF